MQLCISMFSYLLQWEGVVVYKTKREKKADEWHKNKDGEKTRNGDKIPMYRLRMDEWVNAIPDANVVSGFKDDEWQRCMWTYPPPPNTHTRFWKQHEARTN